MWEGRGGRRRNELAILIHYRLLLWEYFSVFGNISLFLLPAPCSLFHILSFICRIFSMINFHDLLAISPASFNWFNSYLQFSDKQKNKKEAGRRCDLGASIGCEPFWRAFNTQRLLAQMWPASFLFFVRF
mgnify:CR=1 FL=1